MGNDFFDAPLVNDLDRVDGRAKVTGSATYAAEYNVPGLAYGVLVGSTITRGTIRSIDAKGAEKAPGVLAVVSHLNAQKVPGYDAGYNPAKGPTGGRGLQVFGDAYVRFNGQPVALVIADSFERAVFGAAQVKIQYEKEPHLTSLENASKTATAVQGPRYADYTRGTKEAWQDAPVKISAEYVVPIEVHNPMELHSIIAVWEGDDKVTVYDKTQGVKATQRSIMQAFKLKEENVKVNAQFVGGGFGSALRTWPHVIAALIGAKKIGRPLKLVLTRGQMFTMVGYRPHALQTVQLGADKDGKLLGLVHEAVSHTSNYEEFSEGVVNMSKFMYACPNVATRYTVYPMDVSTPTWMRGPGEATGAFALECALDELSYSLGIDPLELRLRNYAETDPQKKLPFSTKFLKEAYEMGATKIGWKDRNPVPRSMKEGDRYVGYGMASGVFNANRGTARALVRLSDDGSVVVQSAVSDSGPGTATAMTAVASAVLGVAPGKIIFELGDSSFPPGPTQGGSTTTSTLGSAVHDASQALKKKLVELLKNESVFHTANVHEVKIEDLAFENGAVLLRTDRSKRMSYPDILKKNGLKTLETTEESKGGESQSKYASYSYSVHFVKVLVHPATGVVTVARAVAASDAGKIISAKTAAGQVIGGVVGGIGMALMEEGVIDHRYGRWVNNNLADYHVPVHADVPHIEALFVDKPDFILNPIGAKGIGEIAIIGFAAAVANAVYHATGKRVRDLPITVDKII